MDLIQTITRVLNLAEQTHLKSMLLAPGMPTSEEFIANETALAALRDYRNIIVVESENSYAAHREDRSVRHTGRGAHGDALRQLRALAQGVRGPYC